MYTYIALIRGINFGGRNILPMQELKAIFTAMGFQEVKSYIQSGNIVFKNQTPCTDKTANAIISQIKQIKDFEPNVLLLESSDLKVVLKNNPFPTDNGKVLHFSFLQSKPLKPNLNKLTDLNSYNKCNSSWSNYLNI